MVIFMMHFWKFTAFIDHSCEFRSCYFMNILYIILFGHLILNIAFGHFIHSNRLKEFFCRNPNLSNFKTTTDLFWVKRHEMLQSNTKLETLDSSLELCYSRCMIGKRVHHFCQSTSLQRGLYKRLMLKIHTIGWICFIMWFLSFAHRILEYS